jgi:hypothetical protein
MRKVGAEMDIEIVADRRQVFMMNADDRAEYLNSIKPVLTRMGAMKNAVSAPPVDVADFVTISIIWWRKSVLITSAFLRTLTAAAE